MRLNSADGTAIDVTDWGGPGRPALLLHAWGLNSRMWDRQLGPFAAAGLRCITLDRRGHGRSDRATDGYDIDTLAGDVTSVIEQLDLRDIVLVGHSLGGLEAAMVAAGSAADRIGSLVLSAPTTPCLTAAPDNPLGVPPELLAASRAALAFDPGQWIADGSGGYWGVTDDDHAAETTWTQQTILTTPLPVLLALVDTFTGADVRSLLRTISCPTLVVHGDADQSTPLELTGRPTAGLLPHAELRVIEGAGHGMYTSFAGRYNDAILSWIGG